ncbi:MAG: response regulator [Planctomycetota bacterium]
MPTHTIIIAEDNPGLARVLSFKFQASGFQPLICRDGQYAWDAFQEGNIAAILSDQEMPRMSGIEFCRKVRSVDSDVPFFLVTGRQLELANRGLESELNIRQIFGKPFSPAEVVRAVQEAIDESSAGKSAVSHPDVSASGSA